MIVTVETKSKPCPGVDRAITMAEELLRRGEKVYLLGQLIHNRREIERLENLGLKKISRKTLTNAAKDKYLESYFLIRSHGEMEEIIGQAKEAGFQLVDATCSIVQHSHKLIRQHIRDGWGIVVAGSKSHPEVKGLIDQSNNTGIVVSTIEEAKKLDIEDRSLLIAQTTIDSELFSEIRKILSARFSQLKIVDTTCRFIRNRQKDIGNFGKEQDIVLVVGGKNSSNTKLLTKTVSQVNSRTYNIESPEDVVGKWFTNNEHVGISGGASTPRWQLDELKSILENHTKDNNPKGLNNNKGGKFLWWKRKKPNSTG